MLYVHVRVMHRVPLKVDLGGGESGLVCLSATSSRLGRLFVTGCAYVRQTADDFQVVDTEMYRLKTVYTAVRCIASLVFQGSGQSYRIEVTPPQETIIATKETALLYGTLARCILKQCVTLLPYRPATYT